MNPLVKLAAFAVVLLLAFGVGSAIGSAVGPIDVDEPTHDAPTHEEPSHGGSAEDEPDEPVDSSSTSTTHAEEHLR